MVRAPVRIPPTRRPTARAEDGPPPPVATIAVRRLGSVVRLDIGGASPESLALIRQFAQALNGRPVDPSADETPAFHRPIRLESVGFDERDQVESLAFEADAEATVLVVNDRHQRRAAEFCRRHRHFATSEAMDALAAEFERVGREEARRERVRALERAGGWCLDQAAAAKADETPGTDTEQGPT